MKSVNISVFLLLFTCYGKNKESTLQIYTCPASKTICQGYRMSLLPCGIYTLWYVS